MVATGAAAATDLLTSMGTGAAGMFDDYDGCHSGLPPFARSFANMAASYGCSTPSRTRSRTAKAASWAWASWLDALDIATANNTVAIVMADTPSPAAHGENLQYLAPQDRIYPRYVLVRFAGHHPLWRTNAHRHCNDRERRLCDNGIPDYSVLVLPLHAAHQFVGLYLPDSRPPRISMETIWKPPKRKKALSPQIRPRHMLGPFMLGEKAWNLLNATSI